MRAQRLLLAGGMSMGHARTNESMSGKLDAVFVVTTSNMALATTVSSLVLCGTSMSLVDMSGIASVEST
jgi:hypothetical protein